MVVGVCGQGAVGEIDAAPIEELAAGRKRDEHRRVAVFGDAHGGRSLRSSARHVTLALVYPPRWTRYERRVGGPAKKDFTLATTCWAVPLAS